MGIRENIKQAYIQKALEVRRAQADLKWKYGKKLSHKEILECESKVNQLYLQELQDEPNED